MLQSPTTLSPAQNSGKHDSGRGKQLFAQGVFGPLPSLFLVDERVAMDEQQSQSKLPLVSEIVAWYLRRNSIDAEQIGNVVSKCDPRDARSRPGACGRCIG